MPSACIYHANVSLSDTHMPDTRTEIQRLRDITARSLIDYAESYYQPNKVLITMSWIKMGERTF